MDAVIAVVRRACARNPVVADGLLWCERLAGALRLVDPLRQAIYASHPYAHDAQSQFPIACDDKFRDFAWTHPVIVTEWTTSPKFYSHASIRHASVPQQRVGSPESFIAQAT